MAGRRSKTAWLAARAAPDCNSRLRIGGWLLFVFVLDLPVVKTNALAWALDFFLACKRDARRGHHEPHRDNQNSVYFVHIRPPSSDHLATISLLALFRPGEKAPGVVLRDGGSAHRLEGAIHGAKFVPVFAPAALDLLLVGSLAASIEFCDEIAFAFSDHRLSQRDIAACDIGAGLEDVHRLLARGGLLNRSLDGVQAAFGDGTFLGIAWLRCGQREGGEQHDERAEANAIRKRGKGRFAGCCPDQPLGSERAKLTRKREMGSPGRIRTRDQPVNSRSAFDISAFRAGCFGYPYVLI